MLMEHGGVPHGTEIYNKLTRFLEAGKPLYRDTFQKIQSKIYMIYK
jgi:hypothetical protein